MIEREPRCAWFIPTPVGNILSLFNIKSVNPVHPHACGEHRQRNAPPVCWSGSSPRLWGTFDVECKSIPIQRFIPTPVGNITRQCRCANTKSVHPHACGEHSSRAKSPTPTIGSSPRLWGTLLICRQRIRARWFIPTPVGNIGRLPETKPIFSVHPHACGEHECGGCGRCRAHGSSPRLWGTFDKLRSVLAPGRFIPTPVGNITYRFAAVSIIAVHPHACGEHERARQSVVLASGSSPRLWGTWSL